MIVIRMKISCLLAWGCNSLHSCFPQLSLRMSRPPVLIAERRAGPTRVHHGGHSSPPSLSPRSATGCSRAHLGRISALRMSFRECWEPTRRAARVSISHFLLLVPPQTIWGPQGEHPLGQFACSCRRLASRSLFLKRWAIDQAKVGQLA